MKSKNKCRELVRSLEHDPSSVQEVVMNRLVEALSATNIASVLLYSARENSDEIDLTSLPNYFPTVHFETLGNKRDTLFPEKKFDVIIIPLLGFNEDGYRLGHGGGWYDRFLATQPQALKIGVGYEDTLVDFEAEAHDISMDVIISEYATRNLNGS